MNQRLRELTWELGYTLPEKPDDTRWIPASVPGAIQLDIAHAEGYGPIHYAENWKDYLWMEDRYFTYRSRFRAPVLKKDERLHFVSRGIEYAFEISFNGTILLEQEGMFTPVELDLTEYLEENNRFEIRISPVPKMHASPADRTQAAQSVKPAVGYGWDWHPRLIPLGIWDDTCFMVVSKCRITSVEVDYRLNMDRERADIEIAVEGEALSDHRICWILCDSQGNEVIRKDMKANSGGARILATLENPMLWWPHDHGEPNLYNYTVLLDDHEVPAGGGQIGFRNVELLMNEGAWEEPVDFPKSRSVAPMQLEINGRKIFVKGSNWVHPELFPGTMTPERYDELTTLARQANFNMLRIWGGGIVNKQAFYDQCDAKGIMVWQEFPLACNNYLGTDHYLRVLEQEAQSILKRIRSHPSLAIWSGGNELFNAWSGMTEQSPAIRLLNKLCFEMDPHTPFISTAPLEGMGHGPYVFRDPDTGEEIFTTMKNAHFSAYTEFAIPSPSYAEVIRSAIPEEELWPPRPGGSWESHHAYHAWVGDTWLMQELIEDYFGPSGNLETLIENGQVLQSAGLKAIFETARRQKPYCSMALNWCFNEPWPAAAGTSVVNYPNLKKPSYYAVQKSCRPVLVSGTLEKLKWKQGETFETSLWLLNDSFSIIAGGKITAWLYAGDRRIRLIEWEYPSPAPNENIAGPTARIILPEWNVRSFALVLEAEDPEYSSEYFLLYSPADQPEQKTRGLNR